MGEHKILEDEGKTNMAKSVELLVEHWQSLEALALLYKEGPTGPHGLQELWMAIERQEGLIASAGDPSLWKNPDLAFTFMKDGCDQGAPTRAQR